MPSPDMMRKNAAWLRTNHSVPRFSSSRLRMSFGGAAGAIGVIGAVTGLVGVVVATSLCGPGCGAPSPQVSWAPDESFSWEVNALSDLGVSRVAPWFTSSLVIAGIGGFVFAWVSLVDTEAAVASGSQPVS